MNPPEAVFNEAFKELGGRLHPLPLHLVTSLELHKKRAGDWIKATESFASPAIMPEVYFDYVANGSVNAAASERDGHGYVGLTWGTLIILGDLFCRMLSHPQVMKSIGNAAVENLDPAFQDGIILDGNLLQEKRWGAAGPQKARVWPCMPKDRLRLHCAELCRLLAFDFLCLHELAHVGYGHAQYLKSKTGVPFLLELDSFTPAPDQGVTRQALEMNADAFAASISLTAFLDNREHLVKGIPELNALLRESKTAVFLWAFAIASVFYLYDPTFDLNSLESHNYLPASIRLEGNVKCGLDAAAQAYPDIKKLFEGSKLDLRHVAQAFECVGWKPTNEIGSQYTATRLDPRLEQHVQKVIARLRAIKPELRTYSHFDLDKGNPP